MDGERVGLWAGFLHHVRRDPAMHASAPRTYLGYRDRLQALIQQLPGQGNGDPRAGTGHCLQCA
jgi:TetR/AcrR family transcriptional regulator, transcriptional repressor of bet genes